MEILASNRKDYFKARQLSRRRVFFIYKNKPAVALGHDHFANFCKRQGQYRHMQRCCIPLIDLMRKLFIIQRQKKQGWSCGLDDTYFPVFRQTYRLFQWMYLTPRNKRIKRRFPLVRTGRQKQSVRKWNALFLRSRSINTSTELHNQRNVSAILKKLEELAFNQAFKNWEILSAE